MTSPASDKRLFLGVDGGGTSTVAWLATAPDQIIGRARAGPSNSKAVGFESARAALAEAIAGAFADAGTEARPAAVACLGLAGFDRPDDRAVLSVWSSEAGWADRLVTVNDGDLVVAAGTPEGHGVGVIAGTGSIAVGRTRDGRTARAGGWGYLMGDEGSAYDVVRNALKLVMHRVDGREPAPTDDPLTRGFCRALGVEAPAQLVSAVYAPGFDRTRAAALAPVVLEASREEPELVLRLLEPAGAELAEQVRAVAAALGWPSGPLALGLAGGFLLSAPDVRRALLERLAASAYDVSATPVPEPVLGAVILASRS